MRFTGGIGYLILTAASATGAEVSLHIYQGRPIADGVYVNGRGPYRFLIDTGAESNQLDRRLADAIGLMPSYRVELATAAGAVYVPGIASVRMQFAGVSVMSELLLTPLDSVHMLSSEIQGVLGRAFFGRLDYLLDMRGKRIVLGAREPAGLRTGLDFSGSHPVVSTSLGRLVLDSGTDRLVLFRNAGVARNGLRLRTAAGAIRAEVAARVFLAVAGKEIGYFPALVLPRGTGGQDGFLPANTFSSVYFCNTKGYVVLN